MEDAHSAVADFTECLKLVPPEQPDLYDTVQYNLAVALSKTGVAGKRAAYEMLAGVRRSFCRRRESVQRARFYWMDSMLAWEIGGRNRYRARERMKVSQTAFIRQRMPNELIAVTSDILKTWYPDRDRILAEIESVRPAALRLIKDPVHLRRFDDLRQCLRSASWVRQSQLRHLIRDLRELVTGRGGVLPCLIS